MKTINSEELKHEIKKLTSDDLKKQDKIISLIERYIKFADDMFIKEIKSKEELRQKINLLNDSLDAKELRLTNTIKQYEVSLALNEKTIKEQKVILEYLESKLFIKG